MKIYPIMLKIVAHYLNRIRSFLIIYFVMPHAGILFIWVITHINYYGPTRHYSLTRGWFGEWIIVTYFRSLRTLVFFLYKIRESISTLCQGFFQTDIKFLQNAAYDRFQSTEHICGGTFYRNFQKEKLYESAVVIYRFWNEVRNHLFTVSPLFHR